MSDDDLVTLDSFVFLGEAELARATLEAAGIPAVLADDNVARLGSGGAHAHGGVRLRVRRRDVEEARALLDEEIENTSEPVRELSPSSADRCRRCFSEEVYPISNRLRLYAAWLLAWVVFSSLVAGLRHYLVRPALIGLVVIAPLVMVVAMLIPPKKRCRRCGLEWR